MRVVVTGATGFVGANLTLRLLADGHEVHILTRAQAKFWRLQAILDQLGVHLVDLQDLSSVKGVIAAIRPNWVMHLAAYGAYSYQTDLHQMIHTNITATANLLQACEATGFDVFINTGSSSEYGFKAHAPTEAELPEPNSYYAVTKTAATNLCNYTSYRLSVPITTLRLYSVYGPFEEPTRLMPTVLRNGAAGKYPPLVSPDTARDFVYIDDVVDAYLAAANLDLPLGAVYNIGSGSQTRLRDVVETVQKICDIVQEPVWDTMEQRIWDTNSWVADIGRARHELGWIPKYGLHAGLTRMYQWLHHHLESYPLKT